MMKLSAYQCVWFVLPLLLSLSAVAGIQGYTVSDEEDKSLLTSVTVDRGGEQVIFDASKLIPVQITHFKGIGAAIIAVSAGTEAPAAGERDSILDVDLNSGLLNVGGQVEPLSSAPVLAGEHATPGLAVRFKTPVVNLPGSDVLLFELQRRENSPLAGDPVHLAPLSWFEGAQVKTIETYDIGFEHPEATELGAFSVFSAPGAVASAGDFQQCAIKGSGNNTGFKALAVGIDLSDLGYGEGEAVAGFFLQNVLEKQPAVDPVCIVGLPLPEAPNVLAEAPRSYTDDPALLFDEFLETPVADFEEIVFAIREPGSDHWYANFGYYSAPVREYPPEQRAPEGVQLPAIFKAGGRLCALNLRTQALRYLLEDPAGSIRDPQVHYDGEKILFSYRPAEEDFFHLYEINQDGTGLKQLTEGPYNDIEPSYLPDGDIMFCSDRCMRFVNCWISPVATLYRCAADGADIRMISTNIEHDNTPWPLPDGRMIYMRWEYVDRSQSHFHHLWTTNPDGTAQMVYYGNQRPGITMLDAKPIPGTNKIVASFSPSHGRPEHEGVITIVSPDLGPDAAASAVSIGRKGAMYRDPYPLSEDYFFVARGNEILVLDQQGHTGLVYQHQSDEAGLQVHEPRPLRARKRERIIPPRVNQTQENGRLFLADIYEGRNMEGVDRGTVKELLVLEQLPKPVSFSGGMWPISIGGTFTLARILGTVPVEADGSAFFEVPSMRSLFFVALDEQGLSVKRMQSFLSVMPGESTGCVGCHETRATAPLSQTPLLTAMHRDPSKIQALDSIPSVIDFSRDIQPILTKHCVGCHNPDDYTAKVDLCGDHSPLFSQSYWTMMERGLIADGRNEAYGNRAPRTIGSSASRLMQKIDGSHHEVRVSDHERDMIRLWIESSAPYAGTYAALGSGMFPVPFPVEMMEQRCGSCHGSEPPKSGAIYPHQYFQFSKAKPAYPLVHSFMNLQYIRARMGYYKFGQGRTPQSLCNITRPAKSVMLRAPLAKAAGGLGLCGEEVFQRTDDEGYQSLLTAIEAASTKEQEEKRFNMPGFRPNDYYLYQMQRYGALPKDLKESDPVDSFATDKAYWDLFGYHASQE